jgi:RNA ligase
MRKFPVITHIDRVLEAIADKPEFIVAEREGYRVINYLVALEDTFPDRDLDDKAALLRECRGIVFGEDGKVLARRLHKFFNVGERPETAMNTLPWDGPYVIMDKLDGSMITPILLDGKIRWGTKMGLTDVAAPVEEFINTNLSMNYAGLAEYCFDFGKTPIFEWCSNKQRIVVDHSEDKLVLIHIRDNITGEYVDRQIIKDAGYVFNIPVVRVWSSEEFSSDTLVEVVRGLEGEEGVVVQFSDGEMVKIKSDWYVRLHRAKDKISSERRTLECILNGEIDDLIPILPEDDVTRIRALEHNFTKAVAGMVNNIRSVLMAIHEAHMSRKDFALGLANDIQPLVKTCVFKFFEDVEVSSSQIEEFVLRYVKGHMTNEAKFEAAREQMGF